MRGGSVVFGRHGTAAYAVSLCGVSIARHASPSCLAFPCGYRNVVLCDRVRDRAIRTRKVGFPRYEKEVSSAAVVSRGGDGNANSNATRSRESLVRAQTKLPKGRIVCEGERRGAALGHHHLFDFLKRVLRKHVKKNRRCRLMPLKRKPRVRAPAREQRVSSSPYTKILWKKYLEKG